MIPCIELTTFGYRTEKSLLKYCLHVLPYMDSQKASCCWELFLHRMKRAGLACRRDGDPPRASAKQQTRAAGSPRLASRPRMLGATAAPWSPEALSSSYLRSELCSLARAQPGPTHRWTLACQGLAHAFLLSLWNPGGPTS
ncbi:uncharacterized protein [Vicugna pacos]|uniref:Uncharacterized protein isoform X5 n=1 Tax=Vicugna pacos TaxID=30538 RepID=A0ABM5C8R3_VICPA